MHNLKLLLSSCSSFLYLIFLILFPFIYSKPRNGFSLELIHRDSPISPLYPGHLSDTERANRLVELSNMRVKTFDNSGTYNPQGLRLKLTHDSGSHLVKVQIGSPGVPLYLVVDTGSNLVWTQCEPCTHRFRQIPPIYNSTASHTFKKLPCEHPFCRTNSRIFKCQNGECVYREEYLDGSVTEGVAASDAIEPTRNAHALLYFGCSNNNLNFGSFERTGRSGGIVGLGLSPASLVQQLANITQRRFSYCLVPLYQANASSFLRFGSDINMRGRFQSTPIVSPPNAQSYYLDLQDISVDGNRMRFPPNTFAIKRDGSGGCIIDSGAMLTHIIHEAHETLLRGFQSYFHRYGMEPIRLPDVRYDLCYKTRRSAMPKLPSMTFHFQVADMVIESINIFVTIRAHDAICVAIKSSPLATIIGAVQQVNTRFVYNVADRQILFAPENCAKDR